MITHICFSKYGIYPSEIASHLSSSFYFPSHLQSALSRYQLLFWNKEYFFEQESAGTIARDGKLYHVVYLTQRDWIRKSWCSQVKLSFRAAQPEYNLPAFVLVKSGEY